MLASVAFNKNTGYNKQENGAKCAGKSDKNDEANSHFSGYDSLSIWFISEGNLRYIPNDAKSTVFSENNWDRLPGPSPEVERIKGLIAVPLNKAADALPKLGRLSSPVIRRTILLGTRSVLSWFLPTFRTERPRIVVWLPKVSPIDLNWPLLYLTKKADPFAAVPATQKSDAASLAGVKAVTGPGIPLEAPSNAVHTFFETS